MENNELEKIDMKNRTCYYFDDIMKIKDFEFNNVSSDEKPYLNVLICGVLYKNLIGAKPLCIIFDEVDGFI